MLTSRQLRHFWHWCNRHEYRYVVRWWTFCNEFFEFGRTLCKNGHFATNLSILGGHFVKMDTLQRFFRFWADTLKKWTLCNDFFDLGRTLCKNGHFATIFFILGGHFATTDALQQRILCNSSVVTMMFIPVYGKSVWTMEAPLTTRCELNT